MASPKMLTIRGYNMDTGKPVMGGSFCPRFIYSNSFAKLVQSCGVDDTKVSSILEILGGVHCVGVSPDGKYVCMALKDTVQLWDVSTDTVKYIQTLTGNTEDVCRVEFFYCGNYICASSPNNATKTLHWKLETHLGVDVWRLLTQSEIDRACSKYAKYLNK